MSELAHIQKQFMAVLQGHTSDLASHIAEQGLLSTDERLLIYQNAYKIRLQSVLEQDHQQLGLYLGDELFSEMVAGYLAFYPSKHRSLRQFGDNLPHFLSSHKPFNEHAILTDIATFERSLLQSFDAPDATLLTVEMLEALLPEQWPHLVLNLHPSVQLLSFDTSAVESWQALKNGKPPPKPQLQASHYWVVARDKERRTQYTSINKIECHLLLLIQQQTPFAQLCQSCLNQIDADKVSLFLIEKINQWLERGWLSSFTP